MADDHVIDTPVLKDMERALADPLFANAPDVVAKLRQDIERARTGTPDAAAEIQRFNEAMFVIRRESAPGGIYHEKPWLAEEAEMRVRVQLARSGLVPPTPETPQDIAKREISEQLSSTRLHPNRLAMLERELFAMTEIPAGAANLQREFQERLSMPNLSLDQVLAAGEHFRQESSKSLGTRAALIEDAAKARRAELGDASYDALIADAKRRIQAELARVR